MNTDLETRMRAALLGHAVGDAIGVPAEFSTREHMRRNPIREMRGYGTHNQPPGTWSDDTSLMLCSAEALCDGYDLRRMSQSFESWMFDQQWTPHGEVFDIGQTTQNAIFMFKRVTDPREAGPRSEESNGNGSLMRILPLALHMAQESPKARIDAAMDASCLTHGHPRSQLACAFYVEVAVCLLRGIRMPDAFEEVRGAFKALIEDRFPDERMPFEAILDPALPAYPADELSGSGYVIHTLASSLWCCLNASSYGEAVLQAVNLGEDTDTTGAVTGGLAGLTFGLESIPTQWIGTLSRLADIEDLIARFVMACEQHAKERES